MKYKIYIWVAALLIVSCAAAAAEEVPATLDMQSNISPIVYTEGTVPSTIGGFQISLAEGARVQQIALIGAGANAHLSWSAYTQEGDMVIEVRLDSIVAPGTEEYTLSLLIDDVPYAQAFSITVAEGAPESEGIVVDIPAQLAIGQRLCVPPTAHYADGTALPEETRSEFALEGACFAQTGDGEYTAVAEGVASWSLSLASGNYAFAPLNGSIAVIAESESGVPAEPAGQESAETAASAIVDIDVSGLNTAVPASETGYTSLGNITVTASLASGDTLSADVSGGGESLELFLSEPDVNGNQFSYELLAGSVQGTGTEECVFTARAGDSTASESFSLSIEGAAETQP